MKKKQPDHQPLLDAVYAAPDDDGPRLVLSDFLQEHGDPRGEFIALQFARLRRKPTTSAIKRERSLLKKHRADWLGTIWDVIYRVPAFGGDRSYEPRFERGFLEEAVTNFRDLRVPSIGENPHHPQQHRRRDHVLFVAERSRAHHVSARDRCGRLDPAKRRDLGEIERARQILTKGCHSLRVWCVGKETRMNHTRKHAGSCHCGAIRFEAEIDPGHGGKCNCSICVKVSQCSVIVKPSALEILTDESTFGVYAWGPQISRRYFCKTCGIHCYGRGHLEELGGDFVSINLNCIDDIDIADVKVSYWDGRHDNWEGGMRDRPWPINRPALASTG